MRTQKEIAKEIKALKSLKPIRGQWQTKTQRSIDFAIEELEHGYDDTSEEFAELSDSHQDVIMAARRWKEGASDERPSEGWGALVA